MEKVGIVTWYWGNYGSILQAYALQNTIISLGYKCDIIQHSVNGDIKTQLQYRISHDGISQTIHYYLKKIHAKSDMHKNSEVALRKDILDKFIKKNLILSTQSYNNTDYQKCQEYDIYVCGSDQIWNPNFTFLSSFYWLGFVKNVKKIAYAPSMGNSLLTDSEKRIISNFLQSFTAISVREEKTAKVLNRILHTNDIYTVSDPTMLIDADIWRKKIPERSINRKYLFAYLIRGNKAQRDYIKDISEQHNLTLVTYPYLEENAIENDERQWGDIRCFNDDPFDFLEKIVNSDLVITDSFHCTVFSLLFHKDFYVMKKIDDTTSQFDRLAQLLGMCDENKRIIKIGDEIMPIDDDFANADRAIYDIRIKSRRYLEENLKK